MIAWLDRRRPRVRPLEELLIRHAGTNLYVLPSRHGWVEHARIALEAGLDRFQRILLELPCNLDPAGLTRDLVRLRGAPGVLLLPHEGPFAAQVPEFEGDTKTSPRLLYHSSMIPATHDSIMTTLRWVAERGDPGIVRFIDAPLCAGERIEPRAAYALPDADPHEVTARGLAGWYAQWEPTLAALPAAARDLERERHMADHIHHTLDRVRGNVLFVCGAAHWSRIRALLAGGVPVVDRPAGTPLRDEVRTFVITPATLYSWDVMDIPWLAWRFERSYRRNLPGFDRVGLGDAFLARACARSSDSVNPRTLQLMRRYLERMLRGAGRWSWDLDRHLLDAACAAFGSSFAATVEQLAMRYPLPRTEGVEEGRVISAGDGAFLIVGRTEAHAIRFPVSSKADQDHVRPLRIGRARTWTPHEEERLRPGFGIRMKPPAEERLHKHLCDQARWHAHQLVAGRHETRSHLFRGDLRAGIDTRKTLRALARGDTSVFVKRRTRRPARVADCDGCPVVWVFDARTEVDDRLGDYFQHDELGMLYASFFWFSHYGRFHHVRRSTIAWMVRLHRNITPSWDKELVRRLLFSRMTGTQYCRTPPWSDDELSPRFTGPDLAVACAIKWTTTDHVVIASTDPAYAPGARVADYAFARGIRLLQPAREVFDPILLKRYRIDHEVPVKSDWVPPDPVFLRLIDPVPGFESANGL